MRLFALSRFGKIEFAKVGKNGEIGEGEEENNRIYVFSEKSNPKFKRQMQL